MGKYFGTDGFRGEANVELTPMHAYQVGRYLGWYYGQRHANGERCRIAIGKDTRRSSYMLEDALSAGLTASGADVFLLHVTPTPSVAYVVRSEGFDAGIMISASHNPFYDNGIKLLNGNGEKMEESVIEAIEAWIDGTPAELPLAAREHIGRTTDFSAGRNRYIGHLISLATRSFKNVKVALDCANGSASSIAKNVFDALGATTVLIHAEPNGTNINLSCGSTHMEDLIETVKREHCDLGFAFDGDADRGLVAGDRILYICGKYMRQRGELANNRIVTTIMSNLGLYKALEREGIAYEKTKVGDTPVEGGGRRRGDRLGGEQSGHIIFAKYATTGDGMVTALKLMEVLMETKRPLSKLASEVTIYPQRLVNVPVRDKAAAENNAAVLAAVKREEEALAGDGRVLLRASGTEPLIRVMVEASTHELCDASVSRMVEVLRSEGLVAEN